MSEITVTYHFFQKSGDDCKALERQALVCAILEKKIFKRISCKCYISAQFNTDKNPWVCMYIHMAS
jgi:hypothetical protein